MRHLYYTLQTLLRGRGSNIIKVISLSLGLLMSVFLFARIVFELSFDNFYHEPENLYIVKTGWMNKGVLSGGEGYNTIQTIPAAIAEEFPDEVQSATTSCSLFALLSWKREMHCPSVNVQFIVSTYFSGSCRMEYRSSFIVPFS